MKRLAVIFVFVGLSVGCSELIGEQGNGERITQRFSIDEFSKLEIAGSVDVTLLASDEKEVVIEVDENLMRYIIIEVWQGTLRVDTDRRLNSSKGVLITIPIKNLSKLSSSGASMISSEGQLVCQDLDISLSGAGKLRLDISATSVEVDVSGATIVDLMGNAKSLAIEMSGAGSLDGSDLKVENCNVQISGVGQVLVNVSETLKADVSGMGKVEYLGSPSSVVGDVSGVGNVSKAN